MLATCMNALSLQAALESAGVETRVQTAIEMRVSHPPPCHVSLVMFPAEAKSHPQALRSAVTVAASRKKLVAIFMHVLPFDKFPR